MRSSTIYRSTTNLPGLDPVRRLAHRAGTRLENTTVLRGPLEKEIEQLKREPGGEIGVTGSISVVHCLIAAGVVDEYRLFFYPVVLGRGARLFQDARRVGKLELVECQAFSSGITLMSYRSH